MKRILIIIACIIIPFAALGQQEKQEVLIIGTMHEVPKIVKHSYKPLLRIAKRYSPDAIYVERQRPEDSLSLANYESRWFLPLGDSLARTFEEDCLRLSKLQATSVHQMEQADYAYLRDYYAVNRDKANWSYYNYLSLYGLKGSKKPTRNENGDLTAKLAIHMDMNFVFAMDHQHETQQYSLMARNCRRQSRKDGQIDLLTKNNRKDYIKSILPGLFGSLGKFSNKPKSVRRYETSNRFTFRTSPCAPCNEAAAIWDRRNTGMARNIGTQIEEHGHQRAIVIVGAGHLLGIRDELKKQFPALEVKIIGDL